MRGVYTIAIWFYFRILHFASLFHPKAKIWVSGRHGWKDRIQQLAIDKPVIWFHVASLGEFEQGKPVIDEFKSKHPDWFVLITFFSPSGFEIRKDYDKADYVMYLPEETRGNVDYFLDFFRPKIAVFVKYDFWFEYIRQIHLRSIPLVFFSVIFRSNQLFFSLYGKWFRNQLTQITKIFVQDVHSHELAMDFGIANVEVAGDTRFDRVLDTVEKSEEIPFLSDFRGGNKIIVFGSAWGVETKLAQQIIKSLPEGRKVIYAPHEIDHDKIAQFQSEISAPSVLFTELHSFNVRDAQVLIVNTIGHLARMYKYGDVAVIGGGFNDGIHNILEPLAFGLPVIFGPNHSKFFEAELVIKDKVGFEIQTLSQGQELIHQILGNEVDLVEKTRECQKFISNNIGATPKVSDYLETLL